MPEDLSAHPTRLAGGLALAAALMLAAGSLYPFTGWRSNGLPPWAFLSSGWPRYWTWPDLIVNVAAYLPLGALLTLAASRSLVRPIAVALGIAGCLALSLAVEMTQHYLPSRIPSQFDLACNLAGGVGGALAAAVFGARLTLIEDRFGAFLSRVPQPAYGLALIGAWLLSQLSADAVFVTTGDLRRVLGTPAAAQLSWPITFETVAVAAHMVAFGLIVNRLFGQHRPAIPANVLCLSIAAAAASIAHALWLSPAQAFDWLTRSTVHGLVIGSVSLLLGLLLPPRPLKLLAIAALAIGCVAINLVPEIPYRSAARAPWQLGPYLNVNGLTRWLGLVWPLFAAIWLLAGPWHRSRWHQAVFHRSL